MEIALTFLGGIAFMALLGLFITADNPRKKRNFGTALAILTTGLAVYFMTPPSQRVKLGIDLQGGSSFVIQIKDRVDEKGNALPVSRDDVSQVDSILRKRLEAEISPDIVTKPLGTDRLAIEVPGINEAQREKARGLITKTAQLDFRLVSRDGQLKPGWTKIPLVDEDEDGKEIHSEIVVRALPDISGDLISHATAYPDPIQGWMIHLELKSEGAKKFADITTANQGYPFAIVVDGVAISAPRINEPITQGSCQISGRFTEQSARALATSLNNPLRNPVEFVNSSEISPTYGTNLIKQGLYTGLAGVIATFVFMVLYYRLPGAFAVVALLLNIVMLVGFMALFNLTLTLAGIAGIVLTIGMSVDANVLIYERMREELESGKDGVSAVRAAFSKAFSAIFDSNLTTLICSAIMMSMGSGALKSFAISLTIGIVTSLFAALVVTRVCFLWLVESGKVRNLKTVSIIPPFYYDFLSKARPAVLFSFVLLLASIGIIAFKGEKALGVDFRGGTLIDFTLKPGQTLSEDELKPVIAGIKIDGQDDKGAAQTRSVGSWDVTHHSGGMGVQAVTIRTDEADGASVAQTVTSAFKDKFEGAPTVNQVGAVFGKELVDQAVWALGLSMLGIFLYCALRFEFSFAIGTLVALIHDVIIAAGVTVALGYELSIIHVGSLLTVAGYSVNDTIVIFDRMREMLVNKNLGVGGRIKRIMNEAICATMSRTILTGGTTIFCILTMILFGGPALKDFAIPLLVGILVGTYSTIFTAAPIAYWWAHRGGRTLEGEIQAREEALRAETDV